MLSMHCNKTFLKVGLIYFECVTHTANSKSTDIDEFMTRLQKISQLFTCDLFSSLKL